MGKDAPGKPHDFCPAKAMSSIVRSSHGALRWLAGIGAIAIPGQGTFVAVGPIRAALEGTAFGGLHGALAGSLIGMGVPENRARRYEDRLSSSWFLLSVHNTDSQQTRKAKQILAETLAEDVLSTDKSDADYFNSESVAVWRTGHRRRRNGPGSTSEITARPAASIEALVPVPDSILYGSSNSGIDSSHDAEFDFAHARTGFCAWV